MNYSKFFTSELKKLKTEGLYRNFREIDRPIKKFPKAEEIEVEIISESGQKAIEWESDMKKIKLPTSVK